MIATMEHPRMAVGPAPGVRRRTRFALGAVGALALLGSAAIVAGRLTLQQQINREVNGLFAVSSGVPPAPVTEADLAALPEPVQRWLRAAGVVGMERTAAVRLKQEGDFQLREGWPRLPFTADQYVTTDPPGFLWSPSIRLFPLVSLTGRDRYTGGTGDMQMRLLSAIPVVHSSGGGLNQGAMLRYLGEMGWYPAAALSPSLTWEGIDPGTARATISHGGVTASAVFVIDDAGRFVEVRAERFNDATGKLEQWSGRTRAYGQIGGVWLPVEVESVWHYADRDVTPIRVRLTRIEYNRPERY